MKYIFFILSLIALAHGYADFSNWQPAGEDDSRSPCPALNSLANHNFLPHDGRNLTVPILVKALGDGLNISTELATTLSSLGLPLSSAPGSGAFDLSDLNKHNVIEHDASLSRKDFDLGGESQAFDPETFEEFLDYFNGAEEVGIPEIAAARWGRIQKSEAENPKFEYGDGQLFGTYFETAVYFLVLKDAVAKTAKVEWIETFFRDERLPFEEGWRPFNRIDGLTVAQTVLQVGLHTPEKLPAPDGGYCAPPS